MREHLTPALGAIAVVVAGCSFGSGSDTASSEPVASSTPASTTLVAAPAASTTLVAAPGDTVPATLPATVPLDPVAVTAAASVAVTSSAIPSEVANALRGNGGELVDTADWTERFEPTGIPTLDGPGIDLVEATLLATRTTSGWSRVDELQWLFTSTTSRDDLLDQIAFTAGIAGWDAAVETSIVDAADCTVRRYSNGEVLPAWTVQGCSFDQFPNMVSIGVSRTATVTVTPVGVDPSVASVAADVDGEISSVTVTFGAPEPGSTSTLQMVVEVASDVADPASRIARGALSTWNRSDGEAGLVTFSGAPGSHWNVTSNFIRFSHEGRLAP